MFERQFHSHLRRTMRQVRAGEFTIRHEIDFNKDRKTVTGDEFKQLVATLVAECVKSGKVRDRSPNPKIVSMRVIKSSPRKGWLTLDTVFHGSLPDRADASIIDVAREKLPENHCEFRAPTGAALPRLTFVIPVPHA